MGSLTRFRFGVFEFDPETLELRKSGRPVRLRPQGLKLLKLLISRPREVITREDIARFLWDAGVFVDFEQGVNHTIKQVRAALGDDAESPRYIETLPRRGYRFIAPVEALVAPKEASFVLSTETAARQGRSNCRDGTDGEPSAVVFQSAPPPVIGRIERHRIAIAVVTCALLSILGGGWWAMGRPSVASGSSSISGGTAVPHNRWRRRVFCRRPYGSTHDRARNDRRLEGDCVERGVLVPRQAHTASGRARAGRRARRHRFGAAARCERQDQCKSGEHERWHDTLERAVQQAGNGRTHGSERDLREHCPHAVKDNRRCTTGKVTAGDEKSRSV